MSNEELDELWYLRREIQYLQTEIEHISQWRISADARPQVKELQSLLDQRLHRCQAEYTRGMEYIQAIPDEWTKRAFLLRYVRHRNWGGVGLEMGLTADCCRQMVYRYLKRCGA